MRHKKNSNISSSEAVGRATPREAVERRAQMPADDRGRNHASGHREGQVEGLGAVKGGRSEERNSDGSERDGPRDLGRCDACRDGLVLDRGGLADGSDCGHDHDGTGRWQRQTASVSAHPAPVQYRGDYRGLRGSF